MTARRHREEDDSNDFLGELLRDERAETELERTRAERVEIKKKREALEKPAPDSFISGTSTDELYELAKILPTEKVTIFLGLGYFIDEIRLKEPKERRKALAQLLSRWPPPVPDQTKTYWDGIMTGAELVARARTVRGGGRSTPPDKPTTDRQALAIENYQPLGDIEILLGNYGEITTAGSTVMVVMGVIGGVEPLQFYLRGEPEGTKGELKSLPKQGSNKRYAGAKALLHLPASVPAGTYNLTFFAVDAKGREADVGYTLTVK